MTVPYTFGTATTSIPLSNLDANFNTPITLGNTSIYLGNTTTTIGNLTLTNATISSGNVTLTNVSVTTANVTNITVSGTANIATGNITTLTSTSITDSGLTSGRVTYAGTAGLLQDSANLTFNGTTLTASTGANFVTTSGSVGVGTANPQALLHVGSVAEAPGFGTTTQMCYVNGTSQPELLIRQTANDVVVSMYADSTSGSIRTATNHPLVFFTNNTDRMRLDTSGNLGLGVTPSAWTSGFKAMQMGANGSFYADGTGTYWNNNWFINSSLQAKYLTTNTAQSYEQAGGKHAWYIAPSGTAGDTITFTQAMTLDASGNLSVGSALSHGKIGSFLSDANTTLSSLGYGMLSLMNSSNTNNNYTWMTFNESNQNYVGAIGTQNTIHSGASSPVAGDLVFATKTAGLGGFPTEKMRITSTGTVYLAAGGTFGVGVTSPAGAIGIGVSPMTSQLIIGQNTSATTYGAISFNGVNTDAGRAGFTGGGGDTALYYDVPAGIHTFRITGSTKMVLDASGNLLVGTTTATATTPGIAISGINGSATNVPFIQCSAAASTSTYASYVLYSTTASAYRFYVDYSGTISATSIVITAISDQRLKENIRDIEIGLDAVMALKPRRFDWKEGKGQDKKNVAGFIAQEFETVFPECVGTSKAGGDGIEYKNINHETLIPTLVKAIQEQQALIESLTTRLTALENK